MPPWPDLVFESPPEDPGRLDRVRPLPADVPERFDWAVGALGRARFLGEQFGVSEDHVFARFDKPWSAAATPSYHEDEAAEVADFLERILEQLDAAVGPTGVPHTRLGYQLATSEHVQMQDGGALWFRHPHVSMPDLRAHLETLVRMFRFAATHGLWLGYDRD